MDLRESILGYRRTKNVRQKEEAEEETEGVNITRKSTGFVNLKKCRKTPHCQKLERLQMEGVQGEKRKT